MDTACSLILIAEHMDDVFEYLTKVGKKFGVKVLEKKKMPRDVHFFVFSFKIIKIQI